MLTHKFSGCFGQDIDIETATYGVLEEEVVVLSVDAREAGIKLGEVGEVNEGQHLDVWGQLLVNLEAIVVGLELAYHQTAHIGQSRHSFVSASTPSKLTLKGRC